MATALGALAGFSLPRASFAHDDGNHVHVGKLTINPLPTDIYLGFHRPAATNGKSLTGHGALSAQLLHELPIPEGVTAEQVARAHGTVVVRENGPGKGDILWGLQNVGLIEYKASEGYGTARLLKINFPGGFNLHGAELFYRGPNEMIAAADDAGGRVFVANTTGGDPMIIGAPEGIQPNAWKPTDVAAYTAGLDDAEKGAYRLLITNGYGNPAVVYEYDLNERRYIRSMNVAIDGRSFTPHGIGVEAASMVSIAQRERNLIQERILGADPGAFGRVKRQFDLPHGIRPCDIDWRTFEGTKLACVPVLRGPEAKPGGIAICNDKGQIVSLIDPNSDRPEVQHTHDAAFVPLTHHGEPAYGVVSTSWNPGRPPLIHIFVDRTGYRP